MKKLERSLPIMEMYNKYVAHTYNTLPVVLEEGDGVWVWDVDGKVYLDFWAGYSALNLGHRHPKTWAVFEKANLMTRACYNEDLALLAEKVCGLVNFDSMILPKNSGAEAVETAIKTVRMWAYRTGKASRDQGEIIVMGQNFHGRTITIVSFSSASQYKEDFGPHTSGFRIIPYGDTEVLEKAITPNTIAVLLEPIQGEGGIIVPPENYLREVRDICHKHGILMMLDEIQTGLGRTGKMFCYEHSGITPDILILGKSLCGGTPAILSLVIGKRDVMKFWNPGDDGSTFGGNSAACAVARTVFEVLREEDLLSRTTKEGLYFLNELKKIKNPFIKEVRGKGLFIGIEFYPESGGARKYCEELLKNGLVCKEAHENVLRFSPPLIITREQIDLALNKIRKVLIS